MKTLLTGVCAGLFILACAGVPGQSPLDSPADVGEAARDQLCDAGNEASLSAIADRLHQFDPNADMTALQNQLDSVQANIQQLELRPEQGPLRGAAVTGMGQLESQLADPQTAGDAANTAADALLALDGAVCRS